MSGFDWKGAIGKVAPALAGILGTPAAGVAVAGLCNILGLEPSPENAEKVAEQVAAGQLTGDQLIALRKVEADSVAQLKKMGLDYDLQTEQLVIGDRASARAREISIKDWTPRILAYGVVLVWAAIQGFLIISAMKGRSLPSEMTGPVMRLLGTLDAALTLVLSYYFGSSADHRAQIDQEGK